MNQKLINVSKQYYLTFLGLRFGLIQTKIAIISALLKNKFKLGPNTPSTLEFEEGSLILVGKGGIHLSIEPI